MADFFFKLRDPGEVLPPRAARVVASCCVMAGPGTLPGAFGNTSNKGS